MLKKKIISFLMAGIFVLSSGYNLVYASTFEENEYKQELVNENEFTIINSNENEMIVDKKAITLMFQQKLHLVVGKMLNI